MRVISISIGSIITILYTFSAYSAYNGISGDTQNIEININKFIYNIKSNYIWNAPGCEFAISFPSTPNFYELNSTGITYQQAELVTGTAVLRAECLPFKMTREDVKNGHLLQAERDGFQNWTHKQIDKITQELRGYKSVSGRYATFILRSYIGDNSVLLIFMAAPSDNYPNEDTGAFIDSVAKTE